MTNFIANLVGQRGGCHQVDGINWRWVAIHRCTLFGVRNFDSPSWTHTVCHNWWAFFTTSSEQRLSTESVVLYYRIFFTETAYRNCLQNLFAVSIWRIALSSLPRLPNWQMIVSWGAWSLGPYSNSIWWHLMQRSQCNKFNVISCSKSFCCRIISFSFFFFQFSLYF